MEIKNFDIVKENGWTKIQADVAWGENNYETAYFAVPNNLSDELDITCADNFLVGLMLLAIKSDEDIYIYGASVSKTLVDNIYNFLMPALTQMGCGTGKTKIYADILETQDQPRGFRGATGISMGVDSFYAILKYKDSDKPIDTVLYIAAPGIDEENINLRKNVADELHFRFIQVTSNLVEILDTKFIFSQYHTFYHLAAVLSLKSIGYYYYATADPISVMKLSFDYSSNYDYITSQAISHNNFQMKMAGEDVTRFEKTQMISSNTIVQNNLDVCFNFKERNKRKYLNCSYCSKCNRTLATLEVLGCISMFDKVFDLDLYYKNRSRAWGQLEYNRIIMKKSIGKKLIFEAKKSGLKLPKGRWIVFFTIGIKNQFAKVKKLFKK